MYSLHSNETGQKDETGPPIVKLIRQWGGLSTDALLDPCSQYFLTPKIEGLIGYRKEFGCVVVYGDPVCAPNDTHALAQAFHQSLKGRCKNIIYLTASQSFALWAIQHICQAMVEYGEEIYLDPKFNPQDRQGTHASLVRRKVRHAEKEGISVKEYFPYDLETENAIEQVGKTWQKGRRGAQVHISNIHLFKNRLGKRWFYAQQGEDIVGVVVLNQLKARQGWHLNHLMNCPNAPHGTPEILIISILEHLRNENCPFVSFGALPAEDLGEIIGLTPFSAWTARQAYKIADKIFHLQGHKTFWGKFHPESKPSYLLFCYPKLGLREILAIMRAMNVSF
jgi:lysylphosphatidylglycerol synthetase-like protein (DUF2156 family)